MKPQLDTLLINHEKGAPSIFDQDFLLQNEWAKRLYHDFAAPQPIVDFHNHLQPAHVAQNHRFDHLTELWLDGDHYKWRAMRAVGVSEKYITGNAAPFEKFSKWAATVPSTLRNPLFDWTHLELSRYFGVNSYLNEDSAASIYERVNSQLGDKSVLTLLQEASVEVICTTDDPVDDLGYHLAVIEQGDGVKMRPTFRMDPLFAVHDSHNYRVYLQRLEAVSDTDITDLDQLLAAIAQRYDLFATAGCRLTDVSLPAFPSVEADRFKAGIAFNKVLCGQILLPTDVEQFQAWLLQEMCVMNAERGWTQQFHIGPIRNNNSRLGQTVGLDGGFDSIDDRQQIQGMQLTLDALDQKGALAKSIVYNLNPSWSEACVTMLGNYNDGSVIGKMQYGPAWWFMDQKQGMKQHIDVLSSLGLLSQFVGMVTDSRSFLSFSRHEYFRRILCNVLGAEMTSGELPQDEQWVGDLVKDVCYRNANDYFQF